MTSANALSGFTGIGNGGNGRLYNDVDRYLRRKTSDQLAELRGDKKDTTSQIKQRDTEYWNENSADKAQVKDYISTVYKAPTENTDQLRDAYKKLDISAVSETGQNILLSGFPDVYKNAKSSIEKSNATENDINEMLELLNSPTAKLYQKNKSIDVLDKTFSVTDTNNNKKTYTIKKDGDSFVKEFKENQGNGNNQ